MQAAAKAEYGRLGYVASAFTGAAFTRAATLSRTANDWGYYVHSHGDYYLNARWPALHGVPRGLGRLRAGGDLLEGHQGEASRPARATSSSSRPATPPMPITTMPDAFGIAKTKSIGSANQGPEFYVGYLGLQWDSDEWIFEQRFWNGTGGGRAVGAAFDLAMLGAFKNPDFDANWWGTYQWTGVAGPFTTCTNCM